MECARTVIGLTAIVAEPAAAVRLKPDDVAVLLR